MRAFGRDEVKASERHVFSQTARAPFRWTKPMPGDVVVMDSSSEARTVRWDIETPVDVKVDSYRGSVRLDVEVEASRWHGDLSCVEGIVTVDASWLLDMADDAQLNYTATNYYKLDLREMARQVERGKDGPPEPENEERVWLWRALTGSVEATLTPEEIFEALDWARPQFVAGAATTWTAAGAGNWNTGTNWTGGSEPATNDEVIFNGTSTQTCTINVSTNALTSFSVNAGFTGIINADTDQGGTIAKHGVGTFAAAFTLNSAAASGVQVLMFSDFTMSAGTVAIQSGRQFRTSGTINISAGTWTSGNYIAQNSASANVTMSITMTFILFAAATNDVTYTLQANLTYSSALYIEHFTTTKTVTVAAVATTITGTGSSTFSIADATQVGTNRPGALTFTTGTLDTGTGAVTIGNATSGVGTLGSATAWTFNQDGAATFNVTATFTTPTGTRGWLVGNSVTINASATVTEGSAIGMSQDGSGTINSGQALTMWWEVVGSITCTLGAAFECVEFRLTTGATVAGGGFTLTCNGATATGNTGIVDIPSGTTISGTLDLTVTGIAGARTTLIAGTGNVRNFVDSNAANTHTLATATAAITFDGTLTKSGGGTLTTNGTNSLTSTGVAALSAGTFTPATALLLASGNTTAYGFTISGGTFTGGSAAATFGSLDASAGSTTLTSATTTINGHNGSNVSLLTATGSTWAHGSGTATFTFAGNQYIADTNNTARTTFYNLIVNNATGTKQFGNGTGFALTVANNFTLTAGTFDTEDVTGGTDRNLTVTGITSVTAGTLDCNGSTISLGASVTSDYALQFGNSGVYTGGSGAHTIGSIGANATSTTLTLTSGTTTISSRVTNGNCLLFNSSLTLTHSSGTMDITQTVGAGVIQQESLATFSLYNLTKTTASQMSHYTDTASRAWVVANNLVVTAGTLDLVGGSAAASFTVTGTSNVTGTISMDSAACTYTGNVTINSGGTVGKNSGTGAVNTNGDWTISAGGALSLTGAGMTFNQNTNAKQISVSGTCTITGTAGNNITLNARYALMFATGTPTANLQYVSINGQSGTDDYCLQFNVTPTITNLDNLTLTKTSTGSACIYFNSGGTVITVTNSTFAGTSGAGYHQQHIAVSTSGQFAQLSSCTYTTVGLQATSGWISSITDQTTANAHVFYGILNANSPAAAYQMANADNVTIKQADVYSTSFNSVLTLNQTEQCAALTVNASTTLACAAQTFTETGTCSVSGTVSMTTATVNLDGATTINSGGAFGSNTAYVLDSDANFTVSASGTFNSASSGNMTHSGNLTGSTTMTWNQNGGTTVLDGTSQVVSGFTNDSTTTVLGNLNVQCSTRLDITSGATQMVGSNQSVVLTLNMAGAIGSDGASAVVLRVNSSNTNPIVATSMPTSWTGGSGAGTGTLRLDAFASCNFPAMTFTNGNTLLINAATSSITITQTGTVTVATAGTLNISSLSSSITGATFAQNTRTITSIGLTIGTASGSGLITHTVTTGTITNTSTASESYVVHQDSASGSSTAWTFDCNSWFSIRSGGTFNAPNASGTFTWGHSSDITMRCTGTYNADSGLVTMDGSGAMTWALGSNTFYDVTVSGSGGVTEATSGTASGTGTVSNVLTVNASRTFTMGNTAITLTLSGSGTPFVLNGTFAPGTAATVTYTGSSATDLTGTTYYNVGCNQSGTTFTQAGNVTANGNINITAGTWSKADRQMTWTGTATVAGTLNDLNTAFSQGSSCTGGTFNLTTGAINIRRTFWITVSAAGTTNLIYVPEDQIILVGCTMTGIVLISTPRKGLHQMPIQPLGGGMQGL